MNIHLNVRGYVVYLGGYYSVISIVVIFIHLNVRGYVVYLGGYHSVISIVVIFHYYWCARKP